MNKCYCCCFFSRSWYNQYLCLCQMPWKSLELYANKKNTGFFRFIAFFSSFPFYFIAILSCVYVIVRLKIRFTSLIWFSHRFRLTFATYLVMSSISMPKVISVCVCWHLTYLEQYAWLVVGSRKKSAIHLSTFLRCMSICGDVMWTITHQRTPKISKLIER